MRILVTILILITIMVPGTLSGEVLYLKDGSTLKGTLVRVADTVLVFRSSFGAEFEIHRNKIAKIVFSDSIEVIGMATPPAPRPAAVAAEAGSLLVVFEKVNLSSKINVERGRELEAHLRANHIKQTLIIQGGEVASHIDSTVDKEISQGNVKQYKNVLDPQRLMVAVDPGQYQIEVVVRNLGYSTYQSSFEGRPVDYTLIVSNVVIQPGATTVVKVGHKGKKMGLGKGSLVVRSDEGN